jgi:hypothetical protein
VRIIPFLVGLWKVLCSTQKPTPLPFVPLPIRWCEGNYFFNTFNPGRRLSDSPMPWAGIGNPVGVKLLRKNGRDYLVRFLGFIKRN